MSTTVRLCSHPVRSVVVNAVRRQPACSQKACRKDSTACHKVYSVPCGCRQMSTTNFGNGTGSFSSGGMGAGGTTTVKCHSCGHINTFEVTGSGLQFSACQNENCRKPLLNGLNLGNIHMELKNKEVREDDANKTPSQPPIPYPRKINEYLDQFVIGQPRCKKVLATQVYIHYKRIRHNFPEQPKTAEPFSGDLSLKTHEFHQQLKAALQANSPLGPAPGTQQHQQQPNNTASNTVGSNFDFTKNTLKLEKSNIIIIGPTGTGKTLQVETLAKCLDVPYAKWDCTNLTQAGYVGEDVESVISMLYQNSNQDIHKCQQGIVFLDEVDKLKSTNVSGGVVRDVGGEGVQQSLLKLLEGTVVNVPADKNSSKKLRGQETVQIDTTNILFILSGAFNGLEKVVKNRMKKGTQSFGFGAKGIKSEQQTQSETGHKTVVSDLKNAELERKENNRLRQEVEATDIVRFGFLPEFVGRVPIIATVDDLDQDDLTRILIEPKNSIIAQFTQSFALDGVELEFELEARKAIAEKCLEKKTGARGLRAVVETLLENVQYVLPELGPCKVIINEDFVRGKIPEPHIEKKPDDDSSEEVERATSV